MLGTRDELTAGLAVADRLRGTASKPWAELDGEVFAAPADPPASSSGCAVPVPVEPVAYSGGSAGDLRSDWAASNAARNRQANYVYKVPAPRQAAPKLSAPCKPCGAVRRTSRRERRPSVRRVTRTAGTRGDPHHQDDDDSHDDVAASPVGAAA